MKTHIVFVMDRSGSMSSIADDAAGGFNQFVKEQRKLPGKARLTLIQFNTTNEITCTKSKLKEVPKLVVGENYTPGGMTALNDALGWAINKHEDEKKVIVGVMTDGHENSSHEFSKSAIKALIERKQKDGWEFHYLAAHADAFAEAGQLGISQAHTVQVSADAAGMEASYASMSKITTRYREKPAQ